MSITSLYSAPLHTALFHDPGSTSPRRVRLLYQRESAQGGSGIYVEVLYVDRLATPTQITTISKTQILLSLETSAKMQFFSIIAAVVAVATTVVANPAPKVLMTREDVMHNGVMVERSTVDSEVCCWAGKIVSCHLTRQL